MRDGDNDVELSSGSDRGNAETKRQDLKIRLRDYALRIIRLYERCQNVELSM